MKIKRLEGVRNKFKVASSMIFKENKKNMLNFRNNKKDSEMRVSRKGLLGIRGRNRLRFRRKNRFKYKFRLNYKQRLLKNERLDLGPVGTTIDLGEAILEKKRKKIFDPVKKYVEVVSSKVSLNLFKLTYISLLNYHVPFGKKEQECKVYVQITNVFLYRNQIAVLNILSIFFELRKAINRVFKAVKLRKGIAVLNGRRYSWRRRFTFIFEKWLPGFFTNFWLNINELLSYFFKSRCLSRRQITRAISLKLLNYDYKFFKKRKNTRAINMISYIKLPTVSLSLIDNVFWHRECLKEGIATIQLTDISSDIEKIDYPIISNQKSIPFLSFISLLFKEISYQGRFWEIKEFKKIGYYALNVKTNKNKDRKEAIKRLAAKWLFRYKAYKMKGDFIVKRIRRKFRYFKKLDMRRQAYKLLIEKNMNVKEKIIFKNDKNLRKRIKKKTKNL